MPRFGCPLSPSLALPLALHLSLSFTLSRSPPRPLASKRVDPEQRGASLELRGAPSLSCLLPPAAVVLFLFIFSRPKSKGQRLTAVKG